jgi:hypothetical protein
MVNPVFGVLNNRSVRGEQAFAVANLVAPPAAVLPDPEEQQC